MIPIKSKSEKNKKQHEIDNTIIENIHGEDSFFELIEKST